MQHRLDYLHIERVNITGLLADAARVPMSFGPPTTLERAYELARSGTCVGITDIKHGLIAEGYGDAEGQLCGPVLHKDLHRLCEAARGVGPRVPAKPKQSRRTAPAWRVGR